MDKKIIICPKCGHENLLPLEECKKCGSSFMLFPELRPLFVGEGQLTCPKCGQENDSLSVECSMCGIVYSKYYGIQARYETDKEKKEELLGKKEVEDAKAEALRKQKEEQERVEAVRKEEEEAKAEALRRQREEEERAEAERKQEEEERAEAQRKQREEEEAKAEALRTRKEDEEKKEIQEKLESIITALKPRPKIKDLLRKYEGKAVGINYDGPTEIKSANLVKVGDDFFSIFITDDELVKSYPLRNIISLAEGVNGILTGDMEEKSPFSIVIEVYHPAYRRPS